MERKIVAPVLHFIEPKIERGGEKVVVFAFQMYDEGRGVAFLVHQWICAVLWGDENGKKVALDDQLFTNVHRHT